MCVFIYKIDATHFDFNLTQKIFISVYWRIFFVQIMFHHAIFIHLYHVLWSYFMSLMSSCFYSYLPNSHLYAFMCCYYLKSRPNRWGKVQYFSFRLCLVLWTWWSPFLPISIINKFFPFSWCTNNSTKHTPSHIICPLVCWLTPKLISWFGC